MTLAVLTADIFGLLVVLVIFCNICCNNNIDTYKNKVFSLLVICVFISIAIDAISYSLYFFNIYKKLNYIFAQISFLMPVCITIFYLLYLYWYYKEKTKVNILIFNIGIIYSFIIMAIGIVLSITKTLFNFIDGLYVPGKFYNSYICLYIVIIIYIMLIILYFNKYVNIRDTMAALMFVIFPIVGIIINLFNETAAFSIALLSISILSVYISLQYEINSKLNLLYINTVNQSKLDQLTGLLNRNAYIERKTLAKKSYKTIGIIYSDLNCLKYTNDTFGHNAGDKLLIEYSNLLNKYIEKDHIFRISGDEFVCIIPDVPIDKFNKQIKSLRTEIKHMKIPVAALGEAYGKVELIEDLITNAEKLMYKDKQNFHNKYPIYSRR